MKDWKAASREPFHPRQWQKSLMTGIVRGNPRTCTSAVGKALALHMHSTAARRFEFVRLQWTGLEYALHLEGRAEAALHSIYLEPSLRCSVHLSVSVLAAAKPGPGHQLYGQTAV